MPKKILLLLMLSFISAQGLAKVNDLYSCDEISRAFVASDGTIMDGFESLDHLTFKRTKDEIIFEGWPSIKITSSLDETFTADGVELKNYSYLTYIDGNYYYSELSGSLIMVTIAKCNISTLN